MAQPNLTLLVQKLALTIMVEESESRNLPRVTTAVNFGAKIQPPSFELKVFRLQIQCFEKGFLPNLRTIWGLSMWQIEIRDLWHGLCSILIINKGPATLPPCEICCKNMLPISEPHCNNVSFSVLESSCHIVCQMRILFPV